MDFGDPERDFYNGLLRGIRTVPERLDPLWTGMRHALCRTIAVDQPLLLDYWRAHHMWAGDDPRLVEGTATALVRLHVSISALLSSSRVQADASSEGAIAMLSDLYRDLATHLAPTVVHMRASAERMRLLDRCASLLDAIHTRALSALNLPAGDAGLVALTAAYEHHDAALQTLRAVR
jgi:hypothetical protein